MYDRIKEFQLGILGISLMLGIVLGTVILGNTFLQVKRYPNEVVTVTGSASKTIQSDYATWQGTYGRRSANLSQAYSALKHDTDQIKHYLVSLGLKETDPTFTQISTNTIYARDERGNVTNDIQEYELLQTVNVESADVTLIDKISRRASDLISQNIYMTSEPPQFLYTKLDDLKVEMLGSATRNAYERAQSMAKSTHRNIGLLRSANMGVFQITPKSSTDVSDYGINDTTEREKKVTAVVNATFQLQ